MPNARIADGNPYHPGHDCRHIDTPLRVTFRWPDGMSFAVDDEVYGMGYVPPYGQSDVTNREAPGGERTLSQTADSRRAHPRRR